MASSLAVDGLISGLKTTDLINSLMAVEQIPQTLLKSKVATSQTYITALQSLNAKVASLAELAAKMAKPDSLSTSTRRQAVPTKVTVTAAPGAAAGQLDLTVDALAQAQKSVTGIMPQWPETRPF